MCRRDGSNGDDVRWEVVIDANAPQGDVIDALAALLIDMVERDSNVAGTEKENAATPECSRGS